MEHAPDLPHDIRQVAEGAVIFGDGLFPVPLVDVCAVIVIEEVILADSLHVGAETLAGGHTELAQRHPLPFGGSLDNLGGDGRLEAQPAWKLHGRARPVPVQVVVDAGGGVHNQGHLNHDQVEFATQSS